MSWLSITEKAIKIVDDWLEAKMNKKADDKQRAQIKNHKLDLKDVIRKTDQDVPNAGLEGLGAIRSFIVDKQSNLAHRKLIPLHIRKDGETVYSASLSKIDECRQRLLNAA